MTLLQIDLADASRCHGPLIRLADMSLNQTLARLLAIDLNHQRFMRIAHSP